jgi:hypothetical protein
MRRLWKSRVRKARHPRARMEKSASADAAERGSIGYRSGRIFGGSGRAACERPGIPELGWRNQRAQMRRSGEASGIGVGGYSAALEEPRVKGPASARSRTPVGSAIRAGDSLAIKRLEERRDIRGSWLPAGDRLERMLAVLSGDVFRDSGQASNAHRVE